MSSGLVFNNTFDNTAGLDPQAFTAFQNDVLAAEQYLQSLFVNNCTVNCTFDVQNLNNPNASAENSFNPVYVSYSQYVNALAQHATTPIEQAAVASLENYPDPSGGAWWEIPIGEARILGLASPTPTGTDDTVIFNSQYWTGTDLENYPSDAEGVIEHELTEGIMGRIGSLGLNGVWAPMDLFRFTAGGQRDTTGGQDGQLTYFSVNGNNVYTGLQYHNSINAFGQSDGEDLADWNSVGADANNSDPFGPGGPGAGDPGTLSPTDITIMEALGWAPSVLWNQIDGGTPVAMTGGDFEGLGSAQLAVSESGAGTYLYANGGFTQIDGGVPTMMSAGNLYGTLNGNNNNTDLAAYYPGFGTYVWENGAGWTKIDDGAATAMTTGTFGGGTVADIAASFSGYGVYLWSGAAGWNKIDGGSPTMLAAGNFYGTNNGNANNTDLAAYYPGIGTYIWSANAGWSLIDTGAPTVYATGNFLGTTDGNNNQTDLAAYFPGAGTYIWSANASWQQIDAGAVSGLTAVDLNGTGQNELLAYFPNSGMYEWQAGVGWNKYDPTSTLPLTSQTPLFAAGNFNGGADVLSIAGFANTAGVWLDPPGSSAATGALADVANATLGSAAADTLGYVANADISDAAAGIHSPQTALFGQAIASGIATASNRPANALFHAAGQLLENPTLAFPHPHGSA